MRADYIICATTDIIEYRIRKSLQVCEPRHYSSCRSLAPHLRPFVSVAEWLKGSSVVHGLLMRIISSPKLLQSSTVKLIGRLSLSMFPVVQTKLAERCVFPIIRLLLWWIHSDPCSSDGSIRCPHRSGNRRGPRKKTRS